MRRFFVNNSVLYMYKKTGVLPVNFFSAKSVHTMCYINRGGEKSKSYSSRREMCEVIWKDVGAQGAHDVFWGQDA